MLRKETKGDHVTIIMSSVFPSGFCLGVGAATQNLEQSTEAYQLINSMKTSIISVIVSLALVPSFVFAINGDITNANPEQVCSSGSCPVVQDNAYDQLSFENEGVYNGVYQNNAGAVAPTPVVQAPSEQIDSTQAEQIAELKQLIILLTEILKQLQAQQN